MTDDAKATASRFLDAGMKLATGLILLVASHSAFTLVDLKARMAVVEDRMEALVRRLDKMDATEIRLSVIESNRFTNANGQAMKDCLTKEISEVRSALSAQASKDATHDERLKQIEEALKRKRE